MTNRKEMGKRIRNLRRKAGYTQEKMAERLGISTKHYSEIERGLAGCSLEVLSEIGSVLLSSLDYIVKGTESTDGYSELILVYNSLDAEEKEMLYALLLFVRSVMRKRDKRM